MLWQQIFVWPLLRRKLLRRWSHITLTYRSLTYNSLTSWSTVVDTLMEPLFWIVDRFLKYMGPVFVTLVALLTTSVVLIFYTCLLPHKYELSLGWTLYHLVFGHWLLVNIVFHYVKAAFTLPGSPPKDIPEVVSICKKCIAPKPPRAHHCSVCNRCVLKMDHHCPWLNNCVGHYNHRHFFLFCIYMWMGTVYVTVSAYDLFKQHFYEIRPEYFVDSSNQHTESDSEGPDPYDHHVAGISDENGQYFHHLIVYEFMLCSGVTVALGLLTLWHARMICRGETSIEVHINRKERKRLKKKGFAFRNPYNHGILRNWKIFLGVTHGRSFITQVLLPSNHKPDGDGLQWQNASYSIDSGLMLL